MSTIWELPCSPDQAQRFTVEMGGIVYTVHLKFNRVCQSWVMDLRDEFDRPIAGTGGLSGIPLVTGTDLLGQFRYLGIGGGIPMIVMTIGVGKSPDEVPTWDNLGLDGHVFYKTAV